LKEAVGEPNRLGRRRGANKPPDLRIFHPKLNHRSIEFTEEEISRRENTNERSRVYQQVKKDILILNLKSKK
jgi:hypothetical protein